MPRLPGRVRIAGVRVGTAAALVLVRLGWALIDRIIRIVERVTDRVSALLWRLATTARRPGAERAGGPGICRGR